MWCETCKVCGVKGLIRLSGFCWDCDKKYFGKSYITTAMIPKQEYHLTEDSGHTVNRTVIVHDEVTDTTIEEILND